MDQWSVHSQGRYVLRTIVPDWSPEQLWRTYVQLTEAEAAFRIHKSELSIRPIWHQRKDRVVAQLRDRLGLRLPERLRVPPGTTST